MPAPYGMEDNPTLQNLRRDNFGKPDVPVRLAGQLDPDTGVFTPGMALRDTLESGLAQETTLEALLQELILRLPLSASNAVLVGNNRNKLRDEFASGGLLTTRWQVVTTGAGQSISTGNGTTGSYLLITSGTTANAETIIRSIEIFTLPIRLAATVTASQRIANTEFFIEIIEVNANGAPVTGAPSQPNAGVWRNHAAIKFEGTTATNARLSVRSGGAPEFQGAQVTTQTTLATGTGPNFFPVGWFEAQLTGEHAALLQAPIDSTAAATVASRVTQAAPNPDALYKLQIRLRNLATPPLSSTDYRVHAIRLFDYTRMTTEIIGGPGHTADAMAAPFRMAGTGTVQGNATQGSTAPSPVMPTGVEARTSLPTAVTNGQVVRPAATVDGRQIVKNFSIPQQNRSFNLSLTTTTAQAMAAAPGTGLGNYLTSFWAINTGASAVDLIILDGATERHRYVLPPNVPVPVTFPTEPQVTSNTALNANLSAAGTVRITGTLYIAPA